MKNITKKLIPVVLAFAAILVFGAVRGLAAFSDRDAALLRVDDSSQIQKLVKIEDSNSLEAGEDFHFSGILEKIDGDLWKVGGKVFKVDSLTVLDSGLAVGVVVKVEYIPQPDGTLAAVEIETNAADDCMSVQAERLLGDDKGGSKSGSNQSEDSYGADNY